MLPAISWTSGMRFLDRLDGFDHAQAVRMRGVDGDHVDFAAHQFLRAFEKVAGGADGRADAQDGPARLSRRSDISASSECL